MSIAITDKSGKTKYANEKFCIISKYSAEKLLGQDHRIINSGFHSKEFMRVLWARSWRAKFGRKDLRIGREGIFIG